MGLAVSSTVTQIFSGKFTNMRLIISVTDVVRVRTYEIISEVIVELGDEMKVTIEEPQTIENSIKKRVSPMIIFINSIESFAKIEKKLAYDNMKFRKFFFLVLVDGSFEGIESVMSIFWSFWIYNISIMIEGKNGKISMFSVFPFSNEKCGTESSLKLINEFNSLTRSWKSKIFFPEKFNNLNSCPLKVGGLQSSIPSVIVKKSDKNKENFSGFEVDLMREVADEFNCTTQLEAFESVGSIFENRSIATPGLLPHVFQNKLDAALGTLSLQYDRVICMSETKSFLSVPIVMVIPPAAVLSPFWKLIRPFATVVWILLLSMFLIGFCVAAVAKCSSRNTYNFIVGKGITNPMMNMMIAFFGMSQKKLPRTNFARFLLMKFLLFCLVIRCLYQGKLFIMLQTELHETDIATIDDIMDNNMIFYTYETMAKRVAGFKFAHRCVTAETFARFLISLHLFRL